MCGCRKNPFPVPINDKSGGAPKGILVSRALKGAFAPVCAPPLDLLTGNYRIFVYGMFVLSEL